MLLIGTLKKKIAFTTLRCEHVGLSHSTAEVTSMGKESQEKPVFVCAATGHCSANAVPLSLLLAAKSIIQNMEFNDSDPIKLVGHEAFLLFKTSTESS